MSETNPDLFDAVRRVVAAFDELGVPYFVCGSVASMVFGEPRLTIDADLVARLGEGHATRLVDLLGTEFYASLPTIRDAIRHDGSFNLIHLGSMTKIDVYCSWRSDFARSQFERRIRHEIGTVEPLEVALATPEDTVLAKLDRFRQGGEVSDRQWRDVLGVLKVQGDALDFAYLRRWASRLRLADLLARALDDAGLAGTGPED